MVHQKGFSGESTHWRVSSLTAQMGRRVVPHCWYATHPNGLGVWDDITNRPMHQRSLRSPAGGQRGVVRGTRWGAKEIHHGGVSYAPMFRWQDCDSIQPGRAERHIEARQGRHFPSSSRQTDPSS